VRQNQFLGLWYVLALPLDPRHLGVPSSVFKTIFEPMVCLTQTVLLSCTDANTISLWTETRFNKTHVTEEFRQVHPKQFSSLWYFHCKPCTYLVSTLALSPTDLNELPVGPCHLGVPSGAAKAIFEPWYVWRMPYVYLALTLTVSKWTETRFQVTHVTEEFHRVRQK
jgi:hypothetical protein